MPPAVQPGIPFRVPPKSLQNRSKSSLRKSSEKSDQNRAQNDHFLSSKWVKKLSKIAPKTHSCLASLSDSIFSCFWALRISKTYVLLKWNNGFWRFTLSLSDRFRAPKLLHFRSKIGPKSIQKWSGNVIRNLYRKSMIFEVQNGSKMTSKSVKNDIPNR